MKHENTITKIKKSLYSLPEEKLIVVLDLVTFLEERTLTSDSLQTMIASELVLKRDWDKPEEDAAWGNLGYSSNRMDNSY